MPFSTFTMLKLVLALAAGRLAAADSYTLQKSYTADNFFDGFNFITGEDPTHGFVDYLDYNSAKDAGLAKVSNGGIYLGSDSKSMSPANGRASVRVESKDLYTRMVLVADIAHMPEGCGTWPALWTYGNNWPSHGEIDILEGVNSQASNEITLHTSEGCTMNQGNQLASTKMTATPGDCGAGGGNTGCPQKTVSANNYGTGFNAAGGGFYVMQWDSEVISVWYAPRNTSIANRLSATTNSVDTSTLGTPLAQFSGGSGCDINSHFQSHQITLDNTFCGDWAGADDVWNNDATCSALASSCKEYVANNPQDFSNAYWLINSIRVYSDGSASTNGTTAAATPTATASVRRRVERYRPRK